MDVDVFVARHRAQWDRVDELAGRRRLDGAAAEELVDLYQRTATDLSIIQSSAPDPALVGRLTRTVARAHSRITGANPPAWRGVATFFSTTFPVAVYRARWWCIGAGVWFTVVATLFGIWVAGNPAVQAAIGAPEELRQYVEEDFQNYYSADAASAFASQVWTNNAYIAAMVLIVGALLCLPAIYVLYANALNVGVAGGLMAAHDRLDIFFGLITPHGLLELTAVFVAAGAGIRLGWQVIDPGRITRARAFAREGRAAVAIALGLVVVLLVSGVIEAYVTPSGLSTPARIAIGVVAWGGFLGYVWVLGRRGVRAGHTGDVTGAGETAQAPIAG